MATIKSYTNLEQSRKLAEILPLESADMCYMYLGTEDKEYQDIPICAPALDGDLNCWSLAALLSVLPDHFYDETGRKKFGMDKGDYSYYVFYETQNSYIQKSANNPVDACVAMIEKLHELKKL